MASNPSTSGARGDRPANDAHPCPPDIDGAAGALAKAAQRDSLDLVVEVVKFRYVQEMEASRRRFIGLAIAILALGAAVAGMYIRGAVASIELEVRKGLSSIEESTQSGLAEIDARKDPEFGLSQPSPSQ